MSRVELHYGAATDVGRVREVNEDSYLAAPPVFVVADGMGGHDGGDVASRIVVEEFARLAEDVVAGTVLRGVHEQVRHGAVVRDDREVAIFTVNSVENFGKAKLPIKRVYGDYSRPSLRLVTCGGTWLGGDQGYSDNIVVFASLTGSRER